MQFVKFVEHNEYEGETWNFYLQTEDNEVALNGLKNAIASYDPDNDIYRLTDTHLTEEEVDTLVKYSDSGYMPFETKVVGNFDISLLQLNPVTADDNLYKGGIRDLFIDKK